MNFFYSWAYPGHTVTHLGFCEWAKRGRSGKVRHECLIELGMKGGGPGLNSWKGGLNLKRFSPPFLKRGTEPLPPQQRSGEAL